MKVSLSRLKELVDYNLAPQELADKLALRSMGVKSVNSDWIELDLTYNRGDLLSLRGVAREVAAITDSKVSFDDKPFSKYAVPQSPVKVKNSKLCPVYCVAKIENLKVEKANETWVKKLSDSGIRTVNNIADVTNLIMIEYGQPMHAFDGRGVKDETIIVRTAKKGERITTLDGKTRDLDTSDLTIADSANTLGIAGVMGGKDCEVSDSTNTILLEAAIFDPVQIRRTATRLGLHSEASKRFQHGLTKIRLLQALDGAIKLYQSLGGKLTAITLVGDFGEERKILNLSIKKVNSLLGVKLNEQTITDCLRKLNFTVQAPHMSSGEAVLEVIPPYFRRDIEIEEDLIEEVARIYGYEKIEGKPLEGEKPEPLDQSVQNFIHNLKVSLKDAGLTEVQTYSFYSTKMLQALEFDESKKDVLVRIANPISSETEYLRQFIWPNLVEVVGRNIKQGYKDIGIFEVGKVYFPDPKESYRLAIALMNGTNNPAEELVSIFHKIASHMSSGNVKLKMGGMMKELEALFHPNRYANIEVNGKVIGGLSEIHPRFLNNFGIDKRVAILEIALESLI